MSATKRIIKNSLLMYAVMFLTIIIGFVTSRLIMTRLGVEDFGIYSLIGGLVILFTFINSSMSGSIQRFLSAELGKEDHKAVTEYFNASIIVHIGIALLVLIVGKTIGEWFLVNKLDIPEARTQAAYWVFNTTLVAFICQILSTPAQAMLNAYERMGALALFTFITPFSRFISIIIVGYIAGMDKLVAYSVIIMLFAFVQLAIFYTYAMNKCSGAQISYCSDKTKYKELTSFAGWGLFGDLSNVAKTQGSAVVLNIFWGTTANAAYGITLQLVNSIRNLSAMVTRAANPQIIKRFTSGDKEGAFKLVTQLSKISFSILLVVTLPFILQTEFILKLWLKDVPMYSVLFVRLAILVSLIEISSMPLMTLSKATGKIKLYQIVVGGTLLSAIPITYVVYRFGGNVESIFYVLASTSIVALVGRLLILRKTAKLRVFKFFYETFLKAFILASIVIMIGFCINLGSNANQILISLIHLLIMPVVVALLAIFTMLSLDERKAIKNIIKRK